MTGDAFLDGTVEFHFIDGFSPTDGDAFNFLNVDGGVYDLAFADSEEDLTLDPEALFDGFDIVDIFTLLPGFSYEITMDDGSFTFTVFEDGYLEDGYEEDGPIQLVSFTDGTAVPEPASLGLFGAALAGLAFLRRRWRRK